MIYKALLSLVYRCQISYLLLLNGHPSKYWVCPSVLNFAALSAGTVDDTSEKCPRQYTKTSDGGGPVPELWQM